MILPNWSFGRLIDPDVIAEGLAHLLHAVGAFEQRHRQDDLRFLTVLALKVAADQQIEPLVGAAKFHVGFERDRVVALHQRIQQFVHRDRQLVLQAVREVFALDDSCDGVARGELDESVGAKDRHPAAVEIDDGCLRD